MKSHLNKTQKKKKGKEKRGPQTELSNTWIRAFANLRLFYK